MQQAFTLTHFNRTAGSQASRMIGIVPAWGKAAGDGVLSRRLILPSQFLNELPRRAHVARFGVRLADTKPQRISIFQDRMGQVNLSTLV